MASDADDREICICYHVTFGKVVRYTRQNLIRIKRVSQISQCYGAGTGCGWCVPFLQKIYEDLLAGVEPEMKMSGDEYRQRRKDYHKKMGIERPD
ncbi:MAG: (2Fe-2S)-binding protein [Myxococcales bacterium]|nr:(2Fe-2S)-binding protein [Myxococcales bacterium]